MSILSNLSSKKRTFEVAEPDRKYLAQGIFFIALGTILISCITVTELDLMPRYLLLAAGIILGIFGFFRLLKVHKDAKAFRDYEPAWDKGRGMYDRFAKEYNQWNEDGTPPVSCDGDITYFLKLQQERLKEKGLHMENRVIPGKGNTFGTACLTHKSAWYTSDTTYEEIRHKFSFSNASGELYSRDTEQVMYETIVHSPNEQQLPFITATCPSCGAVNLVSNLTEGCPYCGTKFRMTDLFPRVMNLSFVINSSSHKNMQVFHNTILLTMLAFFAGFFPFFLIGKQEILPLALFSAYLAALIGGGFLGLLLGDLLLLMGLGNRDGMKHISAFGFLRTKRKLKDTMLRYDPNFSYEKFEGQMIFLVRMAVFSNDPSTLSSYRGGTLDERFKDIIEMTYTSGMTLRNLSIENNQLHMTLRTWWINYSEKNGNISKTGDCIDVTLLRNISTPEPPGFSISSVICNGCGASFDAVRQRYCPFCHNEYHMEDKTFIIEDMKLIR